jgi:hypothetical protein
MCPYHFSQINMLATITIHGEINDFTRYPLTVLNLFTVVVLSNVMKSTDLSGSMDLT